MKARLLILAISLISFHHLFAQNQIGTWRLYAATYTNAQMKRESVTQADVDELKIITPTHFMWISQVPDTVNKESKVFGGAGGGHYSLDGIKYVEALEYASWDDYENNITDFSLRVDGDKMYQMGALSNLEGEKTIIEEEWNREKAPAKDGKHVGTWHLVSQKITNPSGEIVNTDMAKFKKVKIISPTHWMYIAETMDGGKKTFKEASGGQYALEGNKYIEKPEFTKDIKTDYTIRVDGDKLYLVGALTDANGKKYMYDEVYQRDKEGAKKVANKLK